MASSSFSLDKPISRVVSLQLPPPPQSLSSSSRPSSSLAHKERKKKVQERCSVVTKDRRREATEESSGRRRKKKEKDDEKEKDQQKEAIITRKKKKTISEDVSSRTVTKDTDAKEEKEEEEEKRGQKDVYKKKKKEAQTRKTEETKTIELKRKKQLDHVEMYRSLLRECVSETGLQVRVLLRAWIATMVVFENELAQFYRTVSLVDLAILTLLLKLTFPTFDEQQEQYECRSASNDFNTTNRSSSSSSSSSDETSTNTKYDEDEDDDETEDGDADGNLPAEGKVKKKKEKKKKKRKKKKDEWEENYLVNYHLDAHLAALNPIEIFYVCLVVTKNVVDIDERMAEFNIGGAFTTPIMFSLADYYVKFTHGYSSTSGSPSASIKAANILRGKFEIQRTAMLRALMSLHLHVLDITKSLFTPSSGGTTSSPLKITPVSSPGESHQPTKNRHHSSSDTLHPPPPLLSDRRLALNSDAKILDAIIRKLGRHPQPTDYLRHQIYDDLLLEPN